MISQHLSDAELQLVLQSDDPPSPQFVEHLEECEQCRDQWENLATGDTTWLLNAAKSDQVEFPNRLVEQLLSDSQAVLKQTLKQLQTVPDTALADLLPNGAEPRQRIGPYEVLGVVGSGGMGIVLQGYDVVLQRTVALKIPSYQMRNDPVAKGRFLREARSAAAINHQNVVPVLAVEEYAGIPVLVMNFVQGESLQQRLDREGKLGFTDAVRIAHQTALALQAAHERGIVHRDVKPANILLESPTDMVRLTDFGLARAGDDARLTQTGVGAGTPLFMSPEQANGDAVDCRSDLFSLGSVLFNMVTGEAPFAASTLMGTLRRLSDGQAAPLRELAPNIPKHLEDLIMDLLKTQRDARPATAAIAAERLQQSLNYLLLGIDPPRQRRRKLWLTGLAFLVTAALLSAGGIVMKFPTTQGILVVEIDDPNTVVTYEQDGQEVSITGVGIKEIKLKLGKLPVKIQGPGSSRQEIVNITRDDKVIVKASLIPLEQATKETPPKVIASAPKSVPVPIPLGTTTSPRSVNRPMADTTKFLDEVFTSNAIKQGSGFFATPGVPQRAIAVSPDGKYLLSASTWPVADGLIRVWDIATKKVVHTMTGSKGDIPTILMSQDGKRAISSSEDGVIRFWDYVNNRETLAVETSKRLVIGMALSPDGKWLATGGDSEFIYILNASTGRLKTKIAVPASKIVFNAGALPGSGINAVTARVRTLAFSPDGERLVAGTESGEAHCWSLQSEKLFWTLKFNETGHNWVEQVQFLDDHHLLVANHKLFLVDAKSGEKLASTLTNTNGITGVQLAPLGNFITTCGSDGNVVIVAAPTQVAGTYSFERIGVLKITEGNANQVRFSKDGKSLFVSCGGSYDPTTQKFNPVDVGIRQLLFKDGGK
jgi:serine/threonine protein kinase/WD40 repeat protein